MVARALSKLDCRLRHTIWYYMILLFEWDVRRSVSANFAGSKQDSRTRDRCLECETGFFNLKGDECTECPTGEASCKYLSLQLFRRSTTKQHVGLVSTALKYAQPAYKSVLPQRWVKPLKAQLWSSASKQDRYRSSVSITTGSILVFRINLTFRAHTIRSDMVQHKHIVWICRW